MDSFVRLFQSYYLVAILDWYSRYVVSWMLDATLEIGFVLDAITQARTIAKPEIWNADQGSHFTSPQVTEPLLAAGVQISMGWLRARLRQYLHGAPLAQGEV